MTKSEKYGLGHLRDLIFRWRFEIAALFFTAVGMYVRVQRLAGRELWLDEINLLNNVVGQLKPVWLRVQFGEATAFPGDYLLKWPFVHWFGPDNKWLINGPHYFAALLAFWLFYKIGKRHIRCWPAFVIAFIFMTFNQWLVYHAFEFRPYAVLPTLALACFYLSGRFFASGSSSGGDQGPWGRWKTFGAGLFFTAVVVYHAYGLMIVGVCLLFFLLRQWPERTLAEIFKTRAVFLIGLLCVMVPVFLWFATGLPQFSREYWWNGGIRTFAYIADPRKEPVGFLRTVMSVLVGFKLFRVNLLIWAIPLAWFVPNRQKKDQLLFFLLLIVVPISAVLAADVLKSYWFLQRQLVWIMPFVALLIGWSVDSLIEAVRDRRLAGRSWGGSR